MSDFKVCAVVPTRNHVIELERVLQRFEDLGIPSFVVDDGSDPDIASAIRLVCSRFARASYLQNAVNEGKGSAVLRGLAIAQVQGLTHAIQLDADGQHDCTALEHLLIMARRNPEAIVSGDPSFDATIPASRRIGRSITTFWVSVNTISLRIKDAMCGFRIYPIASTLELARSHVSSRRMEFDTEILVKAHWHGMAIGYVPVKVTYPKGNTSNFRLVRDNVLLFLMHTRLFFGMLKRLPRLLSATPPRLIGEDTGKNWSQFKERGVYWGLKTLGTIYWLLGRRICLLFMLPVTLFFFLSGHEQREASREYLERVWRCGYLEGRPNWFMSFRHFMSFSSALLDKLAAWTRRIPSAGLDQQSMEALYEVERSGRGVFVITAHLGNPEVLRAMAVLNNRVKVNTLMHTAHADFFNRLLRSFSSETATHAIPVTNAGPALAMQLSEAIRRGEWVIMTGDRVPIAEHGRTIEVPFLGAPASLPQGPYILGAVLGAPCYLMFCVRERGRYRAYFTPFAEKIELPRKNRTAAIRSYAEQFAKAMEERIAVSPFQWFNFYPFWRTAHDRAITREAAE